jgi:hypothetical protein
MALEGERGLVTAFLQLVVSDLKSDRAHLRTEAQEFVADDTALSFWTSLVGLDVGAFRERAQRALGPG